MSSEHSLTQLAEQVRTALQTGDLDSFADLLAPDVTWGAPGDTAPPCRTRNQVLDWYRKARRAGRPANVVDVTAYEGAIVVSVATAPGSTNDIADRWQVLTVGDGQVRDIRGYDRLELALTAARSASSDS